jgi:hypothetical protein
LHEKGSGAVPRVWSKSFCLDAPRGSGLTTVAMSLSPPSTTLFDSLEGYPPWFVAACVTIVALVLVWIAAKLLKWSLYLLMGLVLIAGVALTFWLLFK